MKKNLSTINLSIAILTISVISDSVFASSAIAKSHESHTINFLAKGGSFRALWLASDQNKPVTSQSLKISLAKQKHSPKKSAFEVEKDFRTAMDETPGKEAAPEAVSTSATPTEGKTQI